MNRSYEEKLGQGPPTSLVWTPIPCITWILPFIGHMGITSSNPPYNVSINNMAFGAPTKYYKFNPYSSSQQLFKRLKSNNQLTEEECLILWDYSVLEASREYNNYHVHNLFVDNCHSHVALCLNTFENYLHKFNLNEINIETIKSRLKYGQIDKFSTSLDYNSSKFDAPSQTYNNVPIDRVLNETYNSWTIPKLTVLMFFCGHYMNFKGFILSWLPFMCILAFIILFLIFFH